MRVFKKGEAVKRGISVAHEIGELLFALQLLLAIGTTGEVLLQLEAGGEIQFAVLVGA